ncbi:eCIS core domain-containing protein [Flavobacterium hydrophilum]|uniref:eCIS core domain-containing protein n=1 Tax=Flavobacterium hydrophilum TaxID=2211445 RepID=A0A2V4CKM5_9FLAO|nr:DUF4157 domain-containing protein [Flavobacterium hydrophilum]PXY46374.1 hypothetical protein DMB68_04120 [Flavobacterium hydrophilum]
MREFEHKKIANPSPSPFFGPKIQKKLKTGTTGDSFEVEADKVADKVVNNNFSGGGLLQSKEEPVQKKSEEKEEPVQKKAEEKEEPVQKKAEEKEEPVQKKAEEKEEPVQKKTEEKEEPVQKKAEEKEERVQKKTNEGSIQKKEEKEPTSNIENNLKKGGGNPLNRIIRFEMEKSFGVDFSPIRIHTDDNAVTMCQEMGAQAFTNGVDIYFNKGKYNPNSAQGKKLLAHELTHTIQQGAINQKKK